MTGITTCRQRYHVGMLLLLLLELLPSSLQQTQRSKRQIVFPGSDRDRDRETSSAPCLTPDRRPGDCVPLTSCPVLMGIRNFNRLRRFFCGFDGDEPRVCCPGGGNRQGTTRGTRRTTTPTRTTTPRPVRTTRPPRRTTRPTTTGVLRFTTDGLLEGRLNENKPSFLPRVCGVSRFPKSRIVGGREAEKGSWPWMVVVYQERKGTKSPDCGGALVTNQHVITAAHCVVGRRARTLNPEVLSVRLGEHDLYSNDDEMNPVDVDVLSVVRHENFNPRTYENDIAVLKLVRPVEFNDNISPICLPYDSLRNQDLTGWKSFVAGWGTTSFNGPSSAVLREASFEIQNQEMCKEAYTSELPITDVYICAGTLDGSKDSCQGDSGGPLMSVGKEKRFYLVGIVSFGKLCATPGYPGVYTRVTEYLDWLRNLLAP